MLSLIMTLFLMTGDAQAQTKKLNTDLYEKEPEKEKGESFSAKVKVIRDDGDGMEVFFEGEKNKGAYTLPRSAEHYAKMLKDLEDSRKPTGTPVSVSVGAEKRIKSVEKPKANSPIPSDPNKPWDYGKIPD